MAAMTFEHLEEPEIVITRADTTETLTLVSGALAKMAYAYDYGHHGDAALEHQRWTLVTYGAIAALDDPGDFYRHRGDEPARAKVLGDRVALAMRHSQWEITQHDIERPLALSSTQGVPRREFATLATLAGLVLEAAELLRGEVHSDAFPVHCLTHATDDGAEGGDDRRWAGILAARLDRPDLLEAETTQLMRLLGAH